MIAQADFKSISYCKMQSKSRKDTPMFPYRAAHIYPVRLFRKYFSLFIDFQIRFQNRKPIERVVFLDQG